MFATLRAIAARIHIAAGRHALATGITAAMVTGVAGVGGGVAIGSHSASAATTTPPAPSAPTPPAAGTPQTGKSHHKGGGLAALLVQLTAQQTSQSVSTVVSDLGQGQSLDTIAGSQAQAVATAAAAKVKSELDAKVAAGKLTQDQENSELASHQAEISKLMSEPGTQLAAMLPKKGGGHGAGAPAASPSPTPGG